MKDYLLRLIAHDRWANALLIDYLKAQPTVPPRTMELCGHIIAAHRFWEKRLSGESVVFKDFDFFPRLSLDECAAESDAYARKWTDFINAMPLPIEAPTISFMARSDQQMTFRIVDVFTQLHGHSIHHRAQISVDLRAAGLEPIYTDYILFCHFAANNPTSA
jgi:uncharacterized damage-inducible protein DinB